MKFIYPAVFHREEDGTYTGYFPDLEGLARSGGKPWRTRWTRPHDAAEAWLAVELEEDVPLPLSPTTRISRCGRGTKSATSALPCAFMRAGTNKSRPFSISRKILKKRGCCKKISLLPVHPVFTLSYRHLSAASGIIRLLRNICLGHVYTWMYRKHMYSFLYTSPHIYSRTRVLLHHEFHDLATPLLKERETGFEPATLALARRYSTTEPLAHMKLEQILKPESARRDSNPRPSPWQGDTPPLSHSRIFHVRSREHLRLYYGTVCLVNPFLIKSIPVPIPAAGY